MGIKAAVAQNKARLIEYPNIVTRSHERPGLRLYDTNRSCHPRARIARPQTSVTPGHQFASRRKSQGKVKGPDHTPARAERAVFSAPT